MTGYESKRAAAQDKLTLPEQLVIAQAASDKVEGSIYADYYKADAAVQRLQAALAQPAQRPWVGLTDDEIKEIVGPYGDTPIKGYTRKLFDQIEAALKGNRMTKDEALKMALGALNSGEDAQIGRVVWTEYDSSLVQEAITAIKEALAQPAQRPWVGLTDEEAQWLYDNCRTPSNLIDMVEAKLKEKNT